VWLLIASGDSAQDDTAELTLEEELKKLKTDLKLPERTDAPEDAIGDGPELRVEFSTLRVTRNDPKETALVSMLMNSEADLADLKGKDSVLALQGSWIHEFREGDVFSRAGFRALKGFITLVNDDVVMKYSNRRTSVSEARTPFLKTLSADAIVAG
jgi:hypothetical protein